MRTHSGILAVIQARMEGNRLPGKVLRELCGHPMITHQLARVHQVFSLDEIVVATANTKENVQVLNPILSQYGYKVITPECDPHDVLRRYVATVSDYRRTKGKYPDIIVRITADCPLWCPRVGSDALGAFLSGDAEYLALDQQWGDGLDIEIFTVDLLIWANLAGTKASDREHVTPIIWRNSKNTLLPCPIDLSHQKWSVDEEADFRFVEYVYRHLYPVNDMFAWHDVYTLLEKNAGDPKLIAINAERKPANTGYTEQIAREQGLKEAPTWQEIRYGKEK